MKAAKIKIEVEHDTVLRELQHAIVSGATWRYEQLIEMAGTAGITDEEIDLIATGVVRDLLSGAEQPLTDREFAQGWSGRRTGT